MSKKDHWICGKQVKFKLAFSSEDNFQNLRQLRERKLIFKNIRKNTNSEPIEEYFKQFGTVIDFRVIYKGNSNKKTFGFVTFQDKSTVEKVIGFGTYHHIDKLKKDVNCNN